MPKKKTDIDTLQIAPAYWQIHITWHAQAAVARPLYTRHTKLVQQAQNDTLRTVNARST